MAMKYWYIIEEIDLPKAGRKIHVSAMMQDIEFKSGFVKTLADVPQMIENMEAYL